MLWREGVMCMIEIIYKEESKTEEQESCFQIPVNIRQIGESKGPQKIYMEDYAYTFLKKISRQDKEGRIAILLGEHHYMQGTTYLFIKSALQIKDMEVSSEHLDFNERIWGQVNEASEKYFSNQEVLGWFLSIPGFSMQLNEMLVKTHLDYFAGNEKVLFVVEPGEWDEAFYIFENGKMNRQPGYYIYYEKNEPMQSYMIEMNQNKSIEETENIPDRAVVNFRKTIQNNQNTEEAPKPQKRNWAMGAYVALAFLAVGVAVYSRSENLQRMVLSVFETESEVSDQLVSALPQDANPSVSPSLAPTKKPNQSSFLDDKDQQNEGENAGNIDPNQGGQNLKVDQQEKNPSDSQQTDASSLQEYIIKKGDTLTSISMAHYGNAGMIEEICRINNISSENLILAGQKILLPEHS